MINVTDIKERREIRLQLQQVLNPRIYDICVGYKEEKGYPVYITNKRTWVMIKLWFN